jgi:hypothetical protein
VHNFDREEEKMSEPEVVKQRGEKGEKPEKDREKQEKGRNEKNWDEKWRRDPLNAAAWALILIWLGLTLLASTLEPFSSWTIQNEPLADTWWHFFFLGAGGILLLEAIFRLLVPAYRAPIVGTVILALIFLGIGLADWIENLWVFLLPVSLIIGGLLFLFRGLFRKRE